MPPTGSCAYTLGPQLVALIWKVVEHLKGADLLAETRHWAVPATVDPILKL